MQVWTVRSTHFLGEATTASFHHSNIIRVYTTRQASWSYQDPHKSWQGHLDLSGAYPLQWYLAEYIPDGVDRGLDRGQLFSPDDTTSIAVQICDALSELHSANPQVVHRDLDPGNILLADGDRAVVTDFGLARMEGLPSAYIDEGPISHKGVGAPEQFAGENGDRLTDIYQLGALLVVMLTGKYHNQAGRDLLANRLDIPRSLSETILRCIQQNKADRFQSVVDLRTSLLGRVASAA